MARTVLTCGFAKRLRIGVPNFSEPLANLVVGTYGYHYI
jgi:hypothetical protein